MGKSSEINAVHLDPICEMESIDQMRMRIRAANTVIMPLAKKG